MSDSDRETNSTNNGGEGQAEDRKDNTPGSDIIDWNTFNQILEMDEDESERDFSAGIVSNFFEQAQSTFDEMNTALSEKNLAELSSLGHFLKGSSAALGLTKIKNSCEKIQHLGSRRDETGTSEIIEDEDYLLNKIRSILEVLHADYEQIREYFGEFFQGAL